MSSPDSRKASLIAALGTFIVRLLVFTLRFRMEDRSGILKGSQGPVVWAFWHNRFLVVPYMFSRYFRSRRGAALTSASKDGEMLAGFISRFGIRPVRGSNSRRGVAALLEMVGLIKEGYDIAITPDGPRGPRYSLNPGVVKLAQKTNSPLLPMHITYSRFIQLKSWDAFRIPLPFSRVEIILGEFVHVAKTSTTGAFEAECARIEKILQPQPA